MKQLPPRAEMERAYLERDPAYHGLFFLGVRTTGIFCRPTCPARKPRPENVEFFATAQAALAAGFRPCRRCQPLQHDDQPSWAAKLLADVEREPLRRLTESDLQARGTDPATVRRYFQRRYGLTFQAFARARRLSAVLHRIREGMSLDAAVFDSGYDSHSGFRDAFIRLFGEPPGAYRHGECVRVTWINSPLGPLLAGATAKGICLLEFTDRRMLEAQFKAVRRLIGLPVVPGTNEHTEALCDQLARYFAGNLRSFTVPLLYPGTVFLRRVWEQLRAIPFGETRSYEEVAAAVGAPRAVRAVGHANGLNRLAILIPCHRVVRKDGTLGGYGGGLRRKEFLLALERGGVIPQ